MPSVRRRYCTVREAMRTLGVRSPNTITAWVRRGFLHAFKSGTSRQSRVLIELASVDALVLDRTDRKGGRA